MKTSAKIQIRLSEVREKLNGLAAKIESLSVERRKARRPTRSTPSICRPRNQISCQSMVAESDAEDAGQGALFR